MARSSTFTTYLNTVEDKDDAAKFERLAQRATAAYSRISQAAEDASKRSANLIGGRGTAGLGSAVDRSVTERAGAMRAVARAADEVSRASDREAAAVRRTQSAVRAATSDNDRFVKTLQSTAIALNVAQGPLGPLAGRISAVARAATELTGLRFGLVGAGAALFGLGRSANTFAQLESRLRPLYASQRDVNSALADVVGIAQRSRTALEPVLDLYTRLQGIGQDIGLDAARVSRITELATKAATLSGGSNQAREAGLGQFAQALGAGTLNGDELRSIRENTSQLALAIARGFKNADGSIGTTIGNLKQLGSTGQLTAQEVADALERSASSIEERYSRLPLTLSTAGTQFSNALLLYTGRIDQAVGLTSTLAATVGLVADNLDNVVALGAGIAGAFAANKIAPLGAKVKEVAADFRNSGEQLRTMNQEWVATNKAALTAAQAEQTAALRARAFASARTQAVAIDQQNVRQTISLIEGRAAIEAETAALSVQAQQAANARILAGYEARVAAQEAVLRTATARAAQLQAGEVGLGGRTGQGALQAQLRAARALSAAQQELEDERIASIDRVTRLEAAAAAKQSALRAERFGELRRLVLINREVAAATEAAAAADTLAANAATTAQVAKARLSQALAVAGQRVSVFATRVGVALRSLLSFNVVVFAATTAMVLFATRAKAGEEALESLTSQQRAAVDAIDAVTEAQIRQNGALAFGEIQKRKNAVADAEAGEAAARANLSDRVVNASAAIGFGIAGDSARLRELGNQLRVAGGDVRKTTDEIVAIFRRNPQATQGGLLTRLLGTDPSRFGESLTALRKSQEVVRATTDNLRKAETAANAPAAPRAAATPQPMSAAVLRQQAEVDAINGNTAAVQVANRRYAEAVGRINAKYVEKGKVAPDRAEAYKAEIQGAVEAKDAEIARIRETRAARTAATAERRQQVQDLRRLDADQAREQRDAARARMEEGMGDLEDRAGSMSRQQYLDERLDILRTYDEEVNKIADGAAASNRALQQQVKDTRAVSAARRAITEEMDRFARVSSLTLQGRDTEARALDRMLDLQSQIGDEALSMYGTLLRQAEQEQSINDLLSSRERITSVISGAVDASRDALERLLLDLPRQGPRAAGQFIRSLQDRLSQIGIRQFTETLFAGADAKVRALLSGKSGVEAAAAIYASKMGEAASATDTLVEAFRDGAAGIRAAVSNGGGTSTRIGDDGVEEVVVTGSPARGASLPTSGRTPSGRSVFNTIGQAVGGNLDRVLTPVTNLLTRVFRPNRAAAGGAVGLPDGSTIGGTGVITSSNFFRKIGDSFGTALQGAGQGAIASGFAKALGVKQSALGGQLGGAAGSLLPIPGGAIIGGLVGGTLGGALKPVKQGGSTLTLDGNGQLSAGASFGNSKTARAAASAAASSVAEGVNTILSALGAGISGSPGITVGQRHGDYRVNAGGTSLKVDKGARDFNDDAQAAIEYAVRLTLERSVITGISQASINILRSGQDLQKAIEKATLIESIPKRLLSLTDPVRYAVTQLNDEFSNMISVLKEGGATAEQFADAQKLYELERARAVEQATAQASNAIDQFLKDMVGGSSSPLNKKQTYDAARGEFDKLAAVVNAGGRVDENALLSATRNAQDASRARYGSSQSFFSDFDTFYQVLSKARDNATAAAATGVTGGALPASPFATDSTVQSVLASIGQEQVRATQSQTDALGALLQQVVTGIDNLGYAVTNTSGGGGGSREAFYGLPGSFS